MMGANRTLFGCPMALVLTWTLFVVAVQATTTTTTATDHIDIHILGNNGEPADLYPLPECAGDCDNDDECQEGLICYQRDPGQDVPGCLKGAQDEARTDYCVRTAAATAGVEIFPRPTEAPTFPSPSINDLPTAVPSEEPSQSPSQLLSDLPSQVPSDLPSSVPTVSPQPTASPTQSPTAAPTNARGSFQLRLFWTSKSCWQDECDSNPQWCLQCEGYKCNEGDALWVEQCRPDLPDMQLFDWVPIPVSHYPTSLLRTTIQVIEWGQLQSASSSDNNNNNQDTLCLERVMDRQFRLRICNVETHRQWFRGFDPEQPFELYSSPSTALQALNPGLATHCLTTPHHPRQYEVIYQTSCTDTRKDRTNQWEALYHNDGQKNNGGWVKDEDEDTFNPKRYYRLGPARRNPRCSWETPCGLCQGDCDTDDDCEGSLRCFQRGSRNWDQTPPGCFGDGVPQMDYCYDRIDT